MGALPSNFWHGVSLKGCISIELHFKNCLHATYSPSISCLLYPIYSDLHYSLLVSQKYSAMGTNLWTSKVKFGRLEEEQNKTHGQTYDKFSDIFSSP